MSPALTVSISPSECFVGARNDREADVSTADTFRPMHEAVTVVLAQIAIQRTLAGLSHPVDDLGKEADD